MSEKIFYTEIISALEAMTKKVLICDEYEYHCEFCTLGAWGSARGLDLNDICLKSITAIAKVDPFVTRDISVKNNQFEGSNEGRWVFMRNYVQSKLDKLEDQVTA